MAVVGLAACEFRDPDAAVYYDAVPVQNVAPVSYNGFENAPDLHVVGKVILTPDSPKKFRRVTMEYRSVLSTDGWPMKIEIAELYGRTATISTRPVTRPAGSGLAGRNGGYTHIIVWGGNASVDLIAGGGDAVQGRGGDTTPLLFESFANGMIWTSMTRYPGRGEGAPQGGFMPFCVHQDTHFTGDCSSFADLTR